MNSQSTEVKLPYSFANILSDLKGYTTEKTKLFNQRTSVTAVAVLGIKVPVLRAYAKRFRNLDRSIFDLIPNNAFYETDLLKVILLGNIKCDLSIKLQMADSIKHTIDNWAVCDTLASSLRCSPVDSHTMWEYCIHMLSENELFCRRLAIALMISNFASRIQYTERIFQTVLGNVSYGEYYFDMAVAWLIAECFVHFPEQTLRYLQQVKLPRFVHNKAIAKTCESYRVAEQHKIAVKALKKVN